MGNREDARSAAEKSRNELAAVSGVAEEIRGRTLDKINKRTAQVQERIKQLQDDREALCHNKITRAELLENAIAAFRKQRANYLTEVLAQHLQSCQKAGIEPFSNSSMRIDFFSEYKAFGVFFLAASEADIKEAVKLVEEGDLSAKEREARIKAIDDSIQALRVDLEKDLERIRAEQ